MKKTLIILGAIILSLIITFVFAEVFSLYRFGTVPNFTTFTYLLFIFCFITYILLSLIYIISKKIKKEKVGIKKIVSLILFFISLLLILGFIVILNIDLVTYYSMVNSAPFYVFILVRCLEFLLPSIILIIVGVVLFFRNGENMKKSLKITLLVLSILIGIIVLDTLQAKVFDNSPLIKIRDNLNGENIDYIDKGIFVNHYHCSNKEKVTTWKGTKFTCSVKESNTDEFDFYLTKPEFHNDIRFNVYFTFENRKIYLAGNINQFYVVDKSTMILKEFISNYNRSLDDSIKMITDKLEQTGALFDGGTTIYKSEDKDITLITCQKIGGNNNIFIGDYSLEYTDDLCE